MTDDLDDFDHDLRKAPRIDGFGDPLRRFGSSKGFRWDSLLWGCGSVLFGACGVGGSVFINLFRIGKDFQPVSWLLGSLSALFLLFGPGFLIYGLIAGRRAYWLYPEGLARTGPGGLLSFAWTDVEEIFTWPGSGGTQLKLRSGKKLTIYGDEITDSKTLAKTIRKNVCAVLVPPFLKRLRAGDTIRLGMVRADLEGLTFDRPDLKRGETSFYGWDEFESWYTNEAGLVVLVTPEGEQQLPAYSRDLPNFAVLYAVAGELGR